MKRFHTTDQGEVKACKVTTGSCRYEPAAVHIDFADEAEARFFGEQVLENLYGESADGGAAPSREEIARAKISAFEVLKRRLQTEESEARDLARSASASYRMDQTPAKQKIVQAANERVYELSDRNLELQGSIKDHLYGYIGESVPSLSEDGEPDELGFRGPKPELQDDEMLVYRIEQPSGRGLYNIDGINRELNFAQDSTSGGMLSPRSDGLETSAQTELYGFDSFDQLNAYFSQDALRTVSEFSTDEHPIQISEYIIPRDRARVGGTQLVFDLFSARGTRAMALQDHKGEPDSVRQELQDLLRKRWRLSSGQ